MVGRVRLEQQARWTPGLLVAEVAQPDTRAGLEALPVDERGVDLVVAAHREDVVTVEVHHRPGVAEFGLERQRVREDLGANGSTWLTGTAGAKVVMVSFSGSSNAGVRDRGRGGRCRNGTRTDTCSRRRLFDRRRGCESRWSGAPASTVVSQVPQVPSRHDARTVDARGRPPRRARWSGWTVTVMPVRASSTSNETLRAGAACSRGTNRSVRSRPDGKPAHSSRPRRAVVAARRRTLGGCGGGPPGIRDGRSGAPRSSRATTTTRSP